jgi:membrane-associated phospholipid phosphatase
VREADGTVPRADASAARLLVFGIAVAVILAMVIAWVLADHLRPTAWDMALHRAGMEHRTAGLTAVAVAVSTSSEYLAYVVAAVGTLLALRPRPWWWGAIAGVLLLALGQGIRVALAAAIGRSRPPEADWEMHAAGFALPSGHTATATFAAGLLCLGLARSPRSAWRFVAIAVLALWVVLDGVGRVYLGVHWPTDVVGGWLLGMLLTVLAAGLFLRLHTPRSERGGRPTSAPSGRREARSPEEQSPGGEV